MLIQLKQLEIVAALKQYIAQQGINLTNKDVKIAFTAGRKESGISADVEIEELADIPGYTDADESDCVNKKSADVHQLKVDVSPATEAKAETAETAEDTPKAPTPSLFGN